MSTRKVRRDVEQFFLQVLYTMFGRVSEEHQAQSLHKAAVAENLKMILVTRVREHLQFTALGFENEAEARSEGAASHLEQGATTQPQVSISYRLYLDVIY